MFASLNRTEFELFDKYKFNNYVKNIAATPQQIADWQLKKNIIPKPLTRDDILRIEKATRGQSKNELWVLLRLDRNTASMSSPSYYRNDHSSDGVANILKKPALLFGNAQELRLKANNTLVFERMRAQIENRTTIRCRVVETVIDCGMFFSELGLHAASPDAYFALDDGTWIPVEIKCPYNYRDTTVEQMRAALGSRKARYRVKHTALSVNRVGEPVFEIVKTDPHYRQMQRQMYVMKSLMCFYVVQFKNSLVVKTVNRDGDFFNKEMATETRAYAAFALENLNNAKRFQRTDKRLQSFAINKRQDHNYSDAQINRLVEHGMYLQYGYIKCAYCAEFSKDSRDNFDDVLASKHVNCDRIVAIKRRGHTAGAVFDNPEYFDHVKRYRSLVKCAQYKLRAQRLALFGYYMSECGRLKTFCCGKLHTGIDESVEAAPHHTADCVYYVNMLNRPALCQYVEPTGDL
uniref:Alkaline exonuclease n=1 Tax=Dendrolimus kikuchii nucleopolyhedrovirus TaxID=1219875 RepID=V9LSR5_9ABAC|nr:alkaline exonuclease [Dendrolimus kikuchii nucleopolyhedrovirus]